MKNLIGLINEFPSCRQNVEPQIMFACVPTAVPAIVRARTHKRVYYFIDVQQNQIVIRAPIFRVANIIRTHYSRRDNGVLLYIFQKRVTVSEMKLNFDNGLQSRRVAFVYVKSIFKTNSL